MGSVHSGTISAGPDGIFPRLLMLGDSWLWYPLGTNLPLEISKKYPQLDFLLIGANGSEAADWTKGRLSKEIDRAFKLYARSTGGLLLSGGGNDVAGSTDFLDIIRANCSKAQSPADCYQPGQPAALLNDILGAYRTVILKFRGYNPTSPVYTHNYDHVWPTGKGVFGPADWLKAPMAAAKVPESLRRALFKDLMRRLHEAQVALAAEPNLGPIVVIESTGTLPEDPEKTDTWWANELHPTVKGFRKLARDAFIPMMKPVLDKP